jgi:hypothetical protein
MISLNTINDFLINNIGMVFIPINNCIWLLLLSLHPYDKHLIAYGI